MYVVIMLKMFLDDIFDDLIIKYCYDCGKILAYYYLWIEWVLI